MQETRPPLSPEAAAVLLAARTHSGTPWLDRLKVKPPLSTRALEIAARELHDGSYAYHCTAPAGSLLYPRD